MNELVLIVVIIGSIGVFLLLREFFCWYFKINEIRNLLKRIVELNEPQKNEDQETVTAITNRDQIVICRKCGFFKLKGHYCPECGSGWAGKKVSDNTFTHLSEFAEKENLSIGAAIKMIAICRKCGALRSKDKPCPSCGAK